MPGASGQQQFVWQAGDLVRALQDGALVALEDVHRLAPEALHALGPLLDAGPAARARLPQGGDVQCFLSRFCTLFSNFQKVSFLGVSRFFCIFL